jgi:hypothetical protein
MSLNVPSTFRLTSASKKISLRLRAFRHLRTNSLERLVPRLLRLNAGQLHRHLRRITRELATRLTKIFRNFSECAICSFEPLFQGFFARFSHAFRAVFRACFARVSNGGIKEKCMSIQRLSYPSTAHPVAVRCSRLAAERAKKYRARRRRHAPDAKSESPRPPSCGAPGDFSLR